MKYSHKNIYNFNYVTCINIHQSIIRNVYYIKLFVNVCQYIQMDKDDNWFMLAKISNLRNIVWNCFDFISVSILSFFCVFQELMNVNIILWWLHSFFYLLLVPLSLWYISLPASFIIWCITSFCGLFLSILLVKLTCLQYQVSSCNLSFYSFTYSELRFNLVMSVCLVRTVSLSSWLQIWSNLTFRLPYHKVSSEIEYILIDSNHSISRSRTLLEDHSQRAAITTENSWILCGIIAAL